TMKRVITGLSLIIAGLCLTVFTLRADGEKEKQARASLVGTWRLASMKINGEKNKLPEASVTYKHITPAGFAWLSFKKDTGEVFRSAGGSWLLHGDTYQEKIEYGIGSDFTLLKKTSPSFTCKIAGDKWFHEGKLEDGTAIDEIWERVNPAEQEKVK